MTTIDDAQHAIDDAAPAITARQPESTAARWRDTAVGAAFEAQDAAARLVAVLRQAAARQDQRWAELAERGAVERARGRQRAAATLQTATSAVATSPLVDRIVDAQLERILRPVVVAVLDDVLHLLEQDPDRIQSLVRGQRDTMADELVSRIRSGATAGDTAVDRFTARILHRGVGPVPVPPSPDVP
jgi:hypothetical protein